MAARIDVNGDALAGPRSRPDCFFNHRGVEVAPPVLGEGQLTPLMRSHGIAAGLVADSHTHLGMLKSPAEALAQCAMTGVPFVVDVVDPTDGGAREYGSLSAWLEEAGRILASARAGIATGTGGDGLPGDAVGSASAAGSAGAVKAGSDGQLCCGQAGRAAKSGDAVGAPSATSVYAPALQGRYSQRAHLGFRGSVPSQLARVRLAVGIHPHNARLATAEAAGWLLRLAADPRTCCIGEIGLDYFYNFSPREVQRDVFARQLVLASELGFPVELHLRDAHDDALKILQREGVPEAGVILHCCTLPPEELQPFLDLGCYIAYGGALTFASADPVRAGARLVPENHLLLETDAPYMAPVPLRGVMCTPAMTLFTAAKLAEARGVGVEELPGFLSRLLDNTLSLLDRPVTSWQESPKAQTITAARFADGWVSLEDAARYEADYQRQKREYEAAEQAKRDRHEAEKAARRTRQLAIEQRKAQERQIRRAAGGIPRHKHPKALMFVGSPRHGITEQIARAAAEGLANKGLEISEFLLAGHHVGGCIECDRCIRIGGECFQTGREGDDMGRIDALLDDADLLLLAAPIFFAGPPSQLKAVFDRFQPRWARRYVHGEEPRAKRPAQLLLTGTGGDPYGFDATVTIARSALAIAGFRAQEASVFLLPGSESAGGRLSELNPRIVKDARALGNRIASLAWRSAAGFWSYPLEAPAIDLHDWRGSS